MNKTLFLFLIPCIIGFISAQYGYGGKEEHGYGGHGGVGSQLPYGGYYAGHEPETPKSNPGPLIGGLAFFVLVFLFNISGSIPG